MKPRVISISRVAAFARGFDGKWIYRDYNHRVARRLMEDYPGCEVVDITSPTWNPSTVRYVPEPGHVIYIKSTGGHWGKSVRIRPHPSVSKTSSAQSMGGC